MMEKSRNTQYNHNEVNLSICVFCMASEKKISTCITKSSCTYNACVHKITSRITTAKAQLIVYGTLEDNANVKAQQTTTLIAQLKSFKNS